MSQALNRFAGSIPTERELYAELYQKYCQRDIESNETDSPVRRAKKEALKYLREKYSSLSPITVLKPEEHVKSLWSQFKSKVRNTSEKLDEEKNGIERESEAKLAITIDSNNHERTISTETDFSESSVNTESLHTGAGNIVNNRYYYYVSRSVGRNSDNNAGNENQLFDPPTAPTLLENIERIILQLLHDTKREEFLMFLNMNEKFIADLEADQISLPRDQFVQNECFNKFKFLTNKIRTMCHKRDVFNVIVRLYKQQFRLIQSFYDRDTKLDEIILLGSQLLDITKAAVNVKKNGEHNKIIYLLEDLHEEMLMSPDVIDLKDKSIKVTTFLLSCGECLTEMRDFCKSKIIHKQAIGYMKLAFSSQANWYKVYVFCLRNLAETYLKANDFPSAKKWLFEAMTVAPEVRDWNNSTDEKEQFMSELETRLKRNLN